MPIMASIVSGHHKAIDTQDSIPWLSPIQFKGQAIEGTETLRPFLDHVRDRILSIGVIGAEWWVHKALIQQCVKDDDINKTVDLGVVRTDRMGYQNLRLEKLPSDIVTAAARQGLEFTEGTSFKKVSSAALSDAMPEQSIACRELSIPKIPIPDNRDERIYQPDIGTHQSCNGTLEQWRDLMEWEGRTDAECVIRYLSAYNAFIDSPTVDNLIVATNNPQTSKDPYFLCMSYIAQTFQLGAQADAKPGTPQRAIFDFLSLLHVSFFPHFASKANDGGVSPLNNFDRKLLGALIQQFAATH